MRFLHLGGFRLSCLPTFRPGRSHLLQRCSAAFCKRVEWRHEMAPSTRNRAGLPDVDRILVWDCVLDGLAVRSSQSTASLVVVCRLTGDGGGAWFCVSAVDSAHFLPGWKIPQGFEKSLELCAVLRSRRSTFCLAALGHAMGTDSAVR